MEGGREGGRKGGSEVVEKTGEREDMLHTHTKDVYIDTHEHY